MEKCLLSEPRNGGGDASLAIIRDRRVAIIRAKNVPIIRHIRVAIIRDSCDAIIRGRTLQLTRDYRTTP